MAETIPDEPVAIDIDPELVFFIIVKAREYDGKVAPVLPQSGSNPGDDGEGEIFFDGTDDLTAAELTTAINDLNEDAEADLIAMVWVGRGDFTRAEWAEARKLAFERHARKGAPYLMGIPNLGDLLEEGFTALGYSCEEYEINRL